ncbi:SURF1 family cytochrome oxidase biogenesis protein [Nocardia anaemiae]|uniref:SURF1 family cytochrome oxidase biogenesis protein n=1 Tax=Nocardia anaemiae TaxID=263910 RepID=UPI0007A3F3DA|nr:SURF1 family protein [Nocardia anaemiae]
MRRLTFLLRPSWLILAVLVAAFAYLCFTVLAPWQLGKNTTTSHRNQLIADSVDAAPIDIATVLDDQSTDSHAEWRRVTATGSYMPNSTVLVRLRHLDGAPGYSVLSTFKLDDGRILLIDRGLVAAVDGSRPPQIPDPPTGPQKIEARIRMSEGVTPGKDPTVQDGYRQVYSVDTTQEMTVLQQPLTVIPTGERGGYLQLSENQPGAFTPTPLPQLDAGPYLSYGLQWLAFGIMAPLGLGYFIYAEIRERRKEKATATPEPTPSETPTPASASTNQQRLADRYGGTR